MALSEEKVRATLFGVALGDGLGEYPNLVKEDKPIPPTDDTVMTLALAKVLVSEGKHDPQRVASEYLKLLKEGVLRKVGYTTLRALENFERTNDWFRSGVISKRAAGNGVAMRISPLGIFAAAKNLPLEEFYETVRREGYITHRNELAISGAFAVAYAVYLNLLGVPSKREVVLRTLRVLEELGIENPVKEVIEKVLKFRSEGLTAVEALPLLGTSGYVVHTVGSAFFLFLSKESLLGGLKDLLSVGGDTDTIGAIFGSLIGSFGGMKVIPEPFIGRLEVAPSVESLSKELVRLTG